MRPFVAGWALASLVLAFARLGAQTSGPISAVAPPPSPPGTVLTVAAGESLVLELKKPLSSRTAKKGDKIDFLTTNEILVGDQVAIPRATAVHAAVTEAKRARPLAKAKLQFEFNEVVLADGKPRPISATLTNAMIQPKGEHSKGQVARNIAYEAAQVAILGALFGGVRGAAKGAAVGGVLGTVGAAARHGPDLDFPPGMMFEIELTKPLDVSVAALSQPKPFLASESLRPDAPKDPKALAPPAESAGLPPAAGPGPASKGQPNPLPAVPASTAPSPPTLAAPASRVPVLPGEYKLKVDVDLVVVEATVRDERGAIIDHLKRENFRLFEDGVEQEVRYFSRDELPLAVALVLDRSGSMSPVLEELQDTAYDTLSLLKPQDQVALFAFASAPERLEYLTTDRRAIADDIASMRTGGGTNITDALYDAALYLGRAAPNRRHAIILVSDNEGTVRGYAGEKDVIRTALETETVIYSVKVGEGMLPRVLRPFPRSIPGTGSVPKMARETGGELIDSSSHGSVQGAMATVISRLRQTYSLGYHSSNRRHDGALRQIEVRVVDNSHPSARYTIYARRGYYARKEAVASRAAQP